MLKTLIKMQFSALASQTIMRTRKGRATNKTSPGKIILYSLLLLLCFGYLSVIFGVIFLMLESMTAETAQNWSMTALASFMSMILCFVGTIFTTQSLIFNSKDNDLLISMPIPPRLILLSRITTLAIMNYIFALMIFLPATIAWVMVNGFGLGVLVYLALFIFVPLASMTLTLILGWIIALISSRMKNKSLVTTILSVAAFLVYFLLCFNLGDYITVIEENPSLVSSFISDYLGLFVLMGKAVANLDIIALLITIAVCVLPFAVVIFILSKSFLKIVTDKKSAKKAIYRKKEMKAGTISSALIKKEFQRFFTSATYFLNSFMGIIFMILIAAAIILNVNGIKEFISEISTGLGFLLPIENIMAFFGIAIIIVISAFNIPTSVCISLEGKTLWILQSMPLKAKDVLLAKMRAAVIATSIPNLIFAVIMSILFGLDILSITAIIIVAIAMPIFSSCFGIIINMLMPRFDWVNETLCVKQSGSTIISLLLMLVAAVITVGCGGAVFFLISATGGIILTIALTVIFATISYIIIRNCFEERFRNLG
ncbi:MAG: hypothetical protein KHW62_00700 [Clostridiales bacterium]|nr:hypothetical protein [Clostridiales bacterium]